MKNIDSQLLDDLKRRYMNLNYIITPAVAPYT